MKRLFTIIIIALSSNVLAQPIGYSDWLLEAKKDNRLLPEYGGMPRTAQQKVEDEKYVKTTMEEMNSSRESCSAQMVDLGFKYIANGDLRVAMYRFNQAWLLDRKNAEIYTGFGSVYFIFQDLNESLRWFNRGLELDPNNANLLTYAARSHIAMFEATKTDTASFYKALPLLQRSYEIQPQNAYTTFMLSRYYARVNNCDSAMKYYNECKKSGGQPITEQYSAAMKRICGELMK